MYDPGLNPVDYYTAEEMDEVYIRTLFLHVTGSHMIGVPSNSNLNN
jgi:hypothetical protein